MKNTNHTDYPDFTFPLADHTGQVFDTCVLRATFDLDDEQRLVFSDVQDGPQLHDTYYGDPKTSSLRAEHDRVALKNRGELYLVDPVSRRPAGSRTDSWEASIGVGAIDVRLRVSTQLSSKRGLFDSRGASQQTADAVPLRFETTYGGSNPDDLSDHHAENPVGRGYGARVRETSVIAPQVLHATGGSAETAAAVTPVHRAWSPRRECAGTFDERWKREKFPLYPDDFSYEFFQQAPRHLQLRDSYFAGNETVRVENIGRRARYEFELPDSHQYAVVAMGAAEECAYAHFMLDTVILDLESERVSLVWRSSFIRPEWAVEIAILDADENDG